MAQYTFTKAGVQKTYALDAYLAENFPLYQDMSYSDPDLAVNTTASLTAGELDTLTTLVNDYVDPEVFLVLNSTFTDATWSKVSSSPTLIPVQTFIFTPQSPGGDATFNAFKTILSYTTEDVTAFTGVTDCSATLQIYDLTRNVEIASDVIDIMDIITTWQGMGSGSNTVFRSAMIEGLRNSIANYDCIWQLKISVTNANVIVRSHSIQKLYYNVM